MAQLAFWIDLANSPHVAFFRPIVERLRSAGHRVFLTARDFAQTRGLVERWGVDAKIIGGHGGRSRLGKLANLFSRAGALRAAAAGFGADVALSHNSYSQILAARMLGIKTITAMDFEHTPANRLAFRLAHTVIVPEAWPPGTAERLGASPEKIRRYDGLKEEVYLSNFVPDGAAGRELESLIGSSLQERILVVVRPPPTEAIYHRFENPLFDRVLNRLADRDELAVIVLARNASQKELLAKRRAQNFYFPDRPLDGPTLLYLADAMIGAGGTMNREAALLGADVYTLFAGKLCAADRLLIERGRMTDLKAAMDASSDPDSALTRALRLRKLKEKHPIASSKTLDRIMEHILEGAGIACSNTVGSRRT